MAGHARDWLVALIVVVATSASDAIAMALLRRIVAAQDERARKLERDIHDGAQQQLVALSVKLGLAEQGMADRLDAIGGEVQVRSAPGNGTMVTGTVPAGGATR